jgi:SulP family sulfate permease
MRRGPRRLVQLVLLELLLYAVFGTSRALSVGPVAVSSLMTAAAAGTIAAQGTGEYLGSAIVLALLSGLVLLVLGLLRLGFLANFLGSRRRAHRSS